MPPLPPERFLFGTPFAGWWRRVAASILDALIPFVPVFACGAFLHATGLIDRASEDLWTVVLLVVFLPSFPVYYPLDDEPPRRAQRADVGQAVRSASASCARTARRSTAGSRSCAKCSSSTCCWGSAGIVQLVDYLWPLWDDRNQALHDKIVNTVVVRA